MENLDCWEANFSSRHVRIDQSKLNNFKVGRKASGCRRAIANMWIGPLGPNGLGG